MATANPPDIPAAPPAEAPKPPRKGPGRPRKTIETQAVEIRGVVATPEDPDNYMELVYCNTMLFKDLLKLFNQYNLSDIELAFLPHGIEIESKGTSDKTVHKVTIDGRGLNHYYCRLPIRSCISVSILDNIFFGSGKNYHKITMIAQENYRSKLKIVLHNMEYQVNEVYDLDVGYRPPEQAAAPAVVQCDDDYPVRFTMTKQYFNNSMTKLRKFGNDVLFQKIGGGEFQIQAVSAGRVPKTDHALDNKLFEMECSLDPGDILNVAVPLDYLTPLAKANIGKNVVIALSKTKNISLTTQMAPTSNIGSICTVKIFAEIRAINPGH